MAIIKRSTFPLVLLALISSTVNAQATCVYRQDVAKVREDATEGVYTGATGGFTAATAGNQRTIYSNLCSGTRSQTAIDSGLLDEDITTRKGHNFRRFCDFLDNNEVIRDQLHSPGAGVTVFAPTDSAFLKIANLIGDLNQQDLLELHILPRELRVEDLTCQRRQRANNIAGPRRRNQRSITNCVTAGETQQLGPGNVVNNMRSPTIGKPEKQFDAKFFPDPTPTGVTLTAAGSNLFSQDVTACNGIIHVVDEVLLPGRDNDFPNIRGPNQGVVNFPVGGGGVQHTHGNNPGFGRGNGGRYRRNTYIGYGSKGGKVGKSYNNYRRNNRGYYGRNLDGVEEKPMSDAEFFGTDGLSDIEANIESVKNEFAEKPDESRKRRLEAMLEPDGKIKV